MTVLAVTGWRANRILPSLGCMDCCCRWWTRLTAFRRRSAEPLAAALVWCPVRVGSVSRVRRRSLAVGGRGRIEADSVRWWTTRNGLTSRRPTHCRSVREGSCRGPGDPVWRPDGERGVSSIGWRRSRLVGSTGMGPRSCSLRGSRQAAPSVRERLLAEAAGNPLALLELPAGLSDAQLDGERLPGRLPVTDRLRSALQRIERLPEPTRAALLVAAAEEAGELAVTLRAAAELGLAPDALDPAEEAGLVAYRRRRAQLPPSARAFGRVRVDAAGSAPARTRGAGRRAGRRAALRARRLAPCDGDADGGRGRRGRARGVRAAVAAARRSRLGGDCVRASRDAQRGHPAARQASRSGGRSRLVRGASGQSPGARRADPCR